MKISGKMDLLKEKIPGLNNMICTDCGSDLVPSTTSYKLHSIPPIEIHYLEAYKCVQCGEVYLTRSAMHKIEEIEKKLHEISTLQWEPALSQ